MEVFLKATAVVLISIVICLVVGKQNKDISLLLALMVGCVVIISAMHYLHPIIEFFRKLQKVGQLDPDLFGILLKAVGIGVLSETTSLICADFGNSALGKTLQMLATSVILWISLPLLNKLIDLVGNILEAI